MISRSDYQRRAWWWRWLVVTILAGLMLPGALRAAKSSEDQALAAATVLFNDHQYKLAEKDFSNFLAVYTNSPHRAFATLYLARSRLEQSNYDGAILLLTSGVSQSGDQAAEYVFWIARARLDKGDYAQAAEGFVNLIKNYRDTPRRLEAAFDEAQAWSLLKDWPRVTALLENPTGSFRTSAASDPKNILVTRGWLLLGESLLAQGHYADGEKAVGGIDPAPLEPEWQWQRQYLLCRLEMAGGRAALALQQSADLLDTATGPRHLAASRFLRGEILEKLGRLTDALQSYTNNLAKDVPPDDQRQALLKTVELTLAQNQIPDAVHMLEDYVSQHTNGPAADLARVSLGELYLKMHYSPVLIVNTNDVTVPGTNYLQAARAEFDQVITNFPSSPLLAQAHLDRGWCYWAEQTNMGAARADFQAAVDGLPVSPDQAVARFKLADVEFYQHDYGAAVTNYNLLLRQYADVESVTNGLFDQALYQIIEASLALGDDRGAEDALKNILDWYPNSLFGDRGQLLIGESKRDDYTMARKTFNDLLARSPHTPRLAEVQYAIARTYEQQGDWPEALRKYDQWLAAHAADAPTLKPQVEYSRALDYWKAGMETNALALFTNFVARYPSNDLAALAQNWVADHYFNQGDNQSAEENYELLYQKFPNAGRLAYQGRLWAGRAALARHDTHEASQYFTDLVGNTNAPAELVAQGYFALGDTFLEEFQGNPTNTSLLDHAIIALSTLTNGAPTNAMAAQAYGRLGDCYRQWGDIQWAGSAKHDPRIYADAVQMYQTVLAFPATNADIATRCQAEVALGQIAEQEALPDEALEHYCKVLYELDPSDFDPFSKVQAGNAAARIYQRQQQWDKAIKVYQRVLKAVPSLRPSLEKAIAAAHSAADKAQN